VNETGAALADVLAELKAAGLEASAGQQQQLAEYLALVREAAGRTNLVSTRDLPRLERRHVLESFNLLRPPLTLAGARLLDIGSGAGFPAIPLLILISDLRGVLVESIQKKVVFLEHTLRRLGDGVLEERATVHGGRVEELVGDARHAGRYDVVTARGVGELARVTTWAAPLLRAGGHFAAFKGTGIEKELLRAVPAMERHGMRLDDVQPLRWGQGNIVVLRRQSGGPSART
jgi:16S rRNA (guanine527-N7)-methyltransferase